VTALRVPARPDADGDASPRPIPWRRMAGVTWRQHRAALASVAVLLGALAVWLWRMGVPLHQAYAAAVACHPAASAACQDLALAVPAGDHFMGSKGPGGVLLQVLPALIGAFAGAPVLARELETGTFRFAWTQGFGRWRWALGKLVLLAVVLAVSTAAFGALVAWYYQPYGGTSPQIPGLFENSPFGDLFSLRQVTFPAWTLTAFAIAALAGMLIRRVVPAIAATLALYAGLAFATAGLLREHYLTPLVTTAVSLPGASTAWVLGGWATLNGKFAYAGDPPLNLVNQYCGSSSGAKAGPPGAVFTQCLAPHGYVQWTSYQPASRLWPFQWIEGGWLLALSVLLIAVTVWLVQRRAA
jgi:hypothetical protein